MSEQQVGIAGRYQDLMMPTCRHSSAPEPLATIYASYLHPANVTRDFVSSETVVEAIAEASLFADTNLYLITGVNGSGRAQLNAWLRNQFRTNTVSSDTADRAVTATSTDDGTLSSFFETLAAPLQIQPNITPSSEVTPENLAETALWRLQDRDRVKGLSQTEREQLTSRHSGIDLFEVMTEHISRSVAGETQLGAIPDLLPEETYRQLIEELSRPVPNEQHQSQMVTALHDGLRYALGVKNVHELLNEICRGYLNNGVRPMLFCEEFSTVSPLLRRELLRYFIDSQGQFDIILGTSAQWFTSANHLLDGDREIYCYAKQKATGYLSLCDPNRTPYFTEEEPATSLARQACMTGRLSEEQ
jgi:hypothetical protein